VEKIELRMIHKWLVVASDGLWDVLSEQDVLDIVKTKQSPDEASKFLVKRALQLQTKDNTSVMVLKLN
jgi:serine/threonine protein phosphatase PrpC